MVFRNLRRAQRAWQEEVAVPVAERTAALKRWRRLALRCFVHLTRAVWQVVCSQWHMESVFRHRQRTHAPEFQVTRNNQYAYQLVCATSTGGCGAILQ